MLAGVCLKYTSLPSSTEVSCDREFVINTPLAFLDHYEWFWKKRSSLISTFKAPFTEIKSINPNPRGAHFLEISSNF